MSGVRSVSTIGRVGLWRYAPLFFWIGVIFYLSSGQGSFEHTSLFIGPLLAFLFPDASPETLAEYHGFIRKSAHFIAYAILGFLAYRPFANRRSWPVISLLIVIVVAILDEVNQSYNAARTGTPGDVLLDFAGGLAAVVLIWLIRRRGSTTRGG